MNRERIPPIRVLGHDVEIRSDLGTTSGRESHPVTPFWEVRVDGETIGGVDGAIKNLDELGNAAIELATGYITQMTAEATHKF